MNEQISHNELKKYFDQINKKLDIIASELLDVEIATPDEIKAIQKVRSESERGETVTIEELCEEYGIKH